MYTPFVLLSSLIALASSAALEQRSLQYCGTQPYYTNKYTCYPQNNNLLCPISSSGTIFQPCGTACFDPANYTCINGKLAPVGICNGQVYDKNSYVCVNNFLCPISFPNVCGKACYKTSEYKCVNGKLVQV
ncbi:hypothetical protein K440DRAFT_581657 [Wilcoxina mikolae CBS 423.85]|nr:hypothetical protein K440DRAFT_581657 [Wilcoxina mikolae CBS 423.85]